jgi:hypothetical protein
MNKYILGLDVSTAVTGVCVLSADPSQLTPQERIKIIDKIEFKSSSSFWEKCDRARSHLLGLKDSFGEGTSWSLALEEPLLGFQKGMSSATTITTLMRFNGILSFIGRDIFGADPQYISSASARKLCGIKMQRTSVAGMNGKEQVFKYMSENDLSHIEWPTKKGGKVVDWSRDATDAYVIARAAFLMGNN